MFSTPLPNTLLFLTYFLKFLQKMRAIFKADAIGKIGEPASFRGTKGQPPVLLSSPLPLSIKPAEPAQQKDVVEGLLLQLRTPIPCGGETPVNTASCRGVCAVSESVYLRYFMLNQGFYSRKD